MRLHADLVIVDADERLGKRMGGLGALVVAVPFEGRTADIHTFATVEDFKYYKATVKRDGGFYAPDFHMVRSSVSTGFTDAMREELWVMFKERKLVGRVADIAYSSLRQDGLLVSPVFKGLRPGK